MGEVPWTDVISVVLTGVATVLSVWLAVATSSRGVRLRRDEALWRQILEVEDPTLPQEHGRLVRDLHRHSVAQLIGRRLAPTLDPLSVLIMYVLTPVFPVLLGILAAYVGVRLGDTSTYDWVWFGLLGVPLFVGSTVIASAVLTLAALVVTARNVLAARLFEGEFPVTLPTGGGLLDTLGAYHLVPRSSFRVKVIALGAAVTLSLAGVAGTFWANFSVGGPHLAVIVVSLLVYAIGTFSAASLWRGIVEPPPDLESVYTGQPGAPVRVHARPPGGLRKPAQVWVRLIGMILGAAVGLLVGSLLGAPIGGVLGAVAGYGLGSRKS